MQDSEVEPDPLAVNNSAPPSPVSYSSYISEYPSENQLVYVPVQAIQDFDGRNPKVNPQTHVYNPSVSGSFAQHNATVKAHEINGNSAEPIYYTPVQQTKEGNYVAPFYNKHTIYQTITINNPHALYVVNNPQQ